VFLLHICSEVILLAKTNPRARVAVTILGGASLVVLLYGAMTLWALLFPKTEKTYAIHGRVSFEGSPVPKGEVAFEPPAGVGQVRIAVIRSGTFGLSATEGLPRGMAYVLRVKGFRGTGRKYQNADMSLSAEISEQYLPARYNNESALRFESTPANLRTGLNLDLQ